MIIHPKAGYRFEVRPTHIGGAGAYASQYDWDNPTIIRVSGFAFPETRLTINDDDIVTGVNLYSGYVCLWEWIETYGQPEIMLEDDSTLRMIYQTMGVSLTQHVITNTTDVGISDPDGFAEWESPSESPNFPDDISSIWTQPCAS